MSFSVYVAASSRDIERAELAMNKLRDAGIDVTSTWIDTIRKVGDANPQNATNEQRRSWSGADVAEVMNSDALWLLMPKSPSFGATFEFGFAFAKGLVTWASGPDHRTSIFTALATHQFDSDEDAFDDIVAFAEHVQCGFGSKSERIDSASRRR